MMKRDTVYFIDANVPMYALVATTPIADPVKGC